MAYLSRYNEHAFTLLRVVAGAMFMFHGMQKLFGTYAEMPVPPAMTELWFAAIIEFAAGICIALGSFARVAAFIASGEMAVAYCQVHWKGELGPQMIPNLNRGELPVLYCLIFLYIACRGAGPWSVDAARH